MRRQQHGPNEVQRVQISEPKANTGETIYENPNPVKGTPTAAQKQFVATPYGGNRDARYEMTRAAKSVTVTVKILFYDTKRGENKWLVDKKGKVLTDKLGNKLPDDTYTRDVGEPATIKDAARISFANKQCAAIGGIWDHYDLVGKQVPVMGGMLDDLPGVGDLVRPKKGPIRLKLNFRAQPVFDLDADHHKKVALFGMGTKANRSGAHPIDAGHWYMDTKTNYGTMNLNAISAHEYGHLLGLHDEYSRSNDQVHQQLHLMGGGAASAHKAFDAHTTRQLVVGALVPPIRARMAANIGKVASTILGSTDVLEGQLSGALRSAWSDASVRSSMVSEIEPGLSASNVKRALPRVVGFETGENFSNRTIAKHAAATLASPAITKAAMNELNAWARRVAVETFKAKDAAGQETEIWTSGVSQNWTKATPAGAGTKGGGAIDTFLGKANIKIAPSPSLMAQLETLPDHWKAPGKGMGTAYTPGLVSSNVASSIKALRKAGVFTGIASEGQLYRPIYDLVQNAARKSAQQAIADFVEDAVRGKVRDQMSALQKSIDGEIQAALGMSAGGVAAKSKDPNIKALASSMLTKLQAQQNKKSWKTSKIIHPGRGPGVDIKYTAGSMMGGNVIGKAGFRADMIAPVVRQFNNSFWLRRPNESKFSAETTR